MVVFVSIRDYATVGKKKPLTMRMDEPVENVIKTFARFPDLRGIFIVDKDEEFMGVITRFELLQWVKFKLISIEDVDYEWILVHDIKKYVLPTKAHELINRASSHAYLTLDDPIEKAIKLMTDSNLIDLPIIDADGKIIGDIKLSDMLNKIINS